MKIGAGEAGFEAYTQRQLVTEFTNINSLADHYIRSTIKTLPATLPEPVSRTEFPAPGLLEPFLPQVWISVRGWGWILGIGAAVLGRTYGVGGSKGSKFNYTET